MSGKPGGDGEKGECRAGGDGGSDGRTYGCACCSRGGREG